MKQESVRKKLFGAVQSSATYGRMVGRMAELTIDGKEGNVSICSENYGMALESISLLTRQLVHSLALKKGYYIPQTVQVSLEPQQPNVQWELKQRKIVFSKDISPGTEVKVNYRYE